MKVLIIGLDGATWEVLDDFLLEHHMPNLKELKSKGYSGVLRSTEPPITSAAWTTLLTGCQPRTHGIIGWHEYSFEKDRLQFSTFNNCRVPNIWQELSNQGYQVASINVPWTYPCPKVNGIIVAGHGYPGRHSEFTYPRVFKDELFKHIPDYDVMATFDKLPEYSLKELDMNLQRVERSFQQRADIVKLVTQKIDWDIMMVEFQDIDLMGHFIWPYLGKDTRDQYGSHRDRIFRTFTKLDDVIGDLLDLALVKELVVVVVSDHGQCRKVADIKPNILLSQWGYLKSSGVVKRAIQRWKRSSKMKAGEVTGITQPKDFEFDWIRSKAMVMHLAVNGHLYINVKGRQPYGCVEPGSEFDNIIQNLREKFTNIVNPENGESIFSKVGTAAEIYDVVEADSERFGDLVLVPQQGYELRLSDSSSGRYIRMLPQNSLKAGHSYGGIYVFSGKHIKTANDKSANIVDIAPTVYAALGAKLPSYMDGKVLEEIFITKMPVNYQEPNIEATRQIKEGHVLSAQEEVEITKRLSDLGYIE